MLTDDEFQPGNSLERRLVNDVVALARATGTQIPGNIQILHERINDASWTYPQRRWVELYPDDHRGACCDSNAMDLQRCTCWEPVFDVEQAAPRPPGSPGDVPVRLDKCADCAFRPGSPERADEHLAGQLYDNARAGVPFWCHQGMRRPRLWRHPDGREIPGQPDDWQPPVHGGVAFQADGSPAELCAGWAAIRTDSIASKTR